ncbi:MAG: TolC family protein [Gemmatimonadaceae bacterium]|nr:TolC family protein [Gemmatimonadaceae bacterium]
MFVDVSPHARAPHARRTWPIAALIAASLSSPALLRAQPPAPDVPRQAFPAVDRDSLSLDSVYALVAGRNQRVLAARSLARASAARVATAARPADPQLQLGFMNYAVPSVRPDPALGMTQLQLTWMLPTRGKLAAATAAATARSDAARARADGVWWTMRLEAAMAFYERFEAAGALAVTRDTRRLLDDVAATASAMYRVGDGRQTDVLRARVEIARMDDELLRLSSSLEGATARLAATADIEIAAVAGMPSLPQFRDSLPALEALVQAALTGQPMLDAGQADLRAADADARLARREFWPDVEVGVQYGQRRMDMGIDRMGSVMVGASLPIFARSRQLRMRDETEAMQAMARAELSAMRTETRGKVTQAHTALTSARRLGALYRTTVLPQAEATATSALAAYRAGTVDFMTVIESRMAINRYRQELVALAASEGRAWAELEMLVGQSLLATGQDVAPRRDDSRHGGTR